VKVERLQRLCDFVFAPMVAGGTVYLLQRDETMKGSCRDICIGYTVSIEALKEAAEVM
jgi:hypothetical protein